MVWLISLFTLFGINFSIWAIIGLLRFSSEKVNGQENKHYQIHSFTGWLLILFNFFRLKILIRTTINLLKKKINWVVIKIIRFIPEKIKLVLTKNDYPAYSFLGWVDCFFTISGLKLIFNKLCNRKKLILKIKRLLNRDKKDISPNFIYFNKNKNIELFFANSENFKTFKNIKVEEVAAIIPAHNEELTIAKTINSLKQMMSAKNIYVGSDASTDKTVEIVKKLGCNVFDINPNKGKAGVLSFLIEHFELIDRYGAIIIVDADSELDKNYLTKALPLFDDPKVIAVAAHIKSKWQNHFSPKLSRLFCAYRVRLYRILQTMMRYGQTWKYTNVTSIIPGFASIYRTSALQYINIDAPGLIIEDYNMTFEVHHNKIGKIAYNPKVFAMSQDPINFKDYFKQIKRWNLGFWQTVRRHGFWFSLFSFTTGLFILEMALYGIFFLLVPIILVWFISHSFVPINLPFALPILNISQLSFFDIIIGVFLMDYFITIVISLLEKKPVLLIYGLTFIILRYIDTFIFLYTLPLAFITKSDGRWVSPQRQQITQ